MIWLQWLAAHLRWRLLVTNDSNIGFKSIIGTTIVQHIFWNISYMSYRFRTAWEWITDDRIFILEESIPLSTGWENKDLAKIFMQFCHICNLNRFVANSLGIPMKDRSLVILFWRESRYLRAITHTKETSSSNLSCLLCDYTSLPQAKNPVW